MLNFKVVLVAGGLLAAGHVLAEIEFLTPSASTAARSGQALTSNSTRLQTDSRLYQARYTFSGSNDWTGDLLEFVIPDGGIMGQPPVTSASASAGLAGIINAKDADARKVFTTAIGGNGGVVFDKNYFITASAASASMASYVRGDKTITGLRQRSSTLGDIINSAPQYAGNLDFGYHVLSDSVSSIGQKYITYLSGVSKTRSEVVYVGANDGMLHGFNVTGSDNKLEELLAFIPRTLESKLASLASTSYSHQYYVDGTPKIADAYDSSDGVDEWKTILVGTTGAGGSGVFALDVTDPDNFDKNSVLWEVNNDPAGDFADLGYTLSQPSIVMRPDKVNTWAAIFGSGYADPTNKGVLYFVDLFDVDEVTSLATTSNSGLSTPIVIDSTAKDAVPEMTGDIIYAGDLGGDLWKFYYDGSGWNVHKLFDGDPAQPITAKPQVVSHTDSDGALDGGFMVLFGTGSYFASGAEASVSDLTAPQTFYGIWDKHDGVDRTVAYSDRDADLQEQSIVIIEEPVAFKDGDAVKTVIVRVTTANKLTSNKLGWYLTLNNYEDADKPGYVFQERVVAEPVVRNSRVIFTTLIPDGVPYSGSGWLMELDALTGARLEDVPIDLNGDGKFDEQDMVNVKNGFVVDGSKDLKNVSGVKSEDGLISTPNVVSASNKEFKYLSKSNGQIDTVVESTEGATFSKGRQSWQQIK